jgi:AbrB family looped-hinge helix DNA binding protein
MRITSKGQLTIPQSVREKAGLMPGVDVEVVLENDIVQIRRIRSGKGDANVSRPSPEPGCGIIRQTN